MKNACNLLGPCLHQIGPFAGEVGIHGLNEPSDPLREVLATEAGHPRMGVKRGATVGARLEDDRRPEPYHLWKVLAPRQALEIGTQDRVCLHISVEGVNKGTNVIGGLDIRHLFGENDVSRKVNFACAEPGVQTLFPSGRKPCRLTRNNRPWVLCSPGMRFPFRKIQASLCLILLCTCAPATFARQTPAVVLNEVLASNHSIAADPDFNDYGDWVELYNPGNLSADLSGFTLTDDFDQPSKWTFPDGTLLSPGAFLLVWCDDEDRMGINLHAGFRLSADGEVIGLFDAAGTPLDTLNFGPQTTDVAYGRQPDGTGAWHYLSTPTPGAPNDSEAFAGVAPQPDFSMEGGFYPGRLTLTLSTTLPGGEIRYTLDGSPPLDTDPRYETPLSFESTSVVRAAVFKKDFLQSPVVTHTFFINEQTTLPVLSLVTAPDNFFDDEIGIYVEGTNGIPGRCRTYPVNWNQDWERPVHVEFFEPDGTSGFRLEAGIKIFGGCTRIYPQKSLALYARRVYGPAKIEYQVFPNLPITSFNSLALRSSAQDWWRTMFRDGMIQTVAGAGLDLDHQAYRPALVFINGAYWGIHNLRERLDKHYLETHYGIDGEETEMMESEDYGSSIHHEALIDYVETHDMNLPASLAYLHTQIDVDAYIDYLIAEIYSANADWPGNNLKLWRPDTPEGRWRWMIFDMDFGFGGNAEGQVNSNTLALATAPNGPAWPNPPWSTLLIRKVFENDTFRNTFIQRFALHLNTTFEPEHVLQVIDSLQNNIALEIPRHKARWEKSISFGSSWDELIEIMRDFARRRATYVRTHFYQKFDLSGSARLTFASNDPAGGTLYAAGIRIEEGGDGMVFFKDAPLTVKAVPNPGFVFNGWSGLSQSLSDSLTIILTGEAALTAHFSPGTTSTTPDPTVPLARDLLAPNYPNPFRGTTRLVFETAAPGQVTLAVYDVLGREVQTLVDAFLAPGRQEVLFEASSLAQGVYFYSLKTPRGHQTRRMVRF